MIGSEGGFERAEADIAEAAGAIRIWLGERILRCETCPVAVTAILRLFGDTAQTLKLFLRGLALRSGNAPCRNKRNYPRYSQLGSPPPTKSSMQEKTAERTA